MTEQEAVKLVALRKRELGIDPPYRFEEVEKAIVEWSWGRTAPGAPTHRVAWIVSYACHYGVASVLLDAQTGEILRVERNG